MNEEYIDKIHRYLAGAMNAAEREAFETEIKENPELQNDVELERLLLEGIEHASEAELRQTIGAVHHKLTAEGFFQAGAAAPVSTLSVSHLSKTLLMKRIMAIAATFVVLAGAVWFFTRQEAAAVDPNALFSQNFKLEKEVLRAKTAISRLESVGMAGVQTAEDTLRTALQHFEAGRYDDAQKLLKSHLESHPGDETAQYYLGIVHMSQGRYAKAIELLTPLSGTEGSELKNDALWNLGLCYLKAENGQDDAREAFTKLANDNEYPNHRGAKALLEQLIPKK